MTCGQVLRRLAAFHDGELSIREQIAVEGHLLDCAACAAEAGQLQTIGEALRGRSAELSQVSFDDESGLKAGVISRMKAERDESVASRVGRLFEDLHFVYAGLGAAGATLACLLIMLGMMRFGAHERPDSLAALVEVLAAPAEPAGGLSADGRTLVAPQEPSDDSGRRSDAVFALSAFVTHEGRIRNLDVIHSDGVPGSGQQAREEILNLMDSIMETQLQPVTPDGVGVFVGPGPSLAWRLHVTVRGKMPHVTPASAPHLSRKSADRQPLNAVLAVAATL